MARYVVISFEDNAAAESFVAEALGGELADAYHSKVEVWGMYFKPTQFCECKNPGPRQSRGKKYGLWIDACGKPIRGHVQHARNLLIAPSDWERLTAQQKASYYLGTRDGLDLPHMPINSFPDA